MGMIVSVHSIQVFLVYSLLFILLLYISLYSVYCFKHLHFGCFFIYFFTNPGGVQYRSQILIIVCLLYFFFVDYYATFLIFFWNKKKNLFNLFLYTFCPVPLSTPLFLHILPCLLHTPIFLLLLNLSSLAVVALY